MLKITSPTWAEISLSALKANFRALQRLAKGSEVLPVVKANAYGHGSVEVSKALVSAGAKFLAVAFVEEGAVLRKGGLRVPILVLTPTLPIELPVLLKNKLIPQVSSLEGARAVSKAAQKMGLSRVGVHVKVDTGMGRVGVRPSDVLKVLDSIQKVPRLRVDGLYTHLATADWTDPKFAWGQITQFRQTLEKVHRNGLMPATHVANSAALITYYPQSKGTWVRPGIALYGVYPNPSLKNKVELTPVMQVKTKVLHVKEMEAGESVSYGRTYRAPRKIKVATLAMGYADGVPRTLSNKGYFLVRGKKVPILGTVCMDMTMVDVTKVPRLRVGEQALFFGAGLPVEDQAALAGTISYELLCGISGRVPRIYK
jgi:alanine racemase